VLRLEDELARLRAPDLVLSDVMMPRLDGFGLLRALRDDPLTARTPIVLLSARAGEEATVEGLEAGADDYLVKPVRLAELHARLRAHLRRGGSGTTGPAVRAVGDLVVDVVRHRVTVAGGELHLRPKEFDLLARLAAQPEVAHSREQLMADVWDENWFGSTKTLDVHVAALRRKLQDGAPPGHRVPQIVTVRGHGYRLELAAPGCGGASR